MASGLFLDSSSITGKGDGIGRRLARKRHNRNVNILQRFIDRTCPTPANAYAKTNPIRRIR